MTLYPEIQAHAREEVDRVYGEGPPGDFEGQEKMPYLRAILLECLRWNPPVSAGLLTLVNSAVTVLLLTDIFGDTR